jgi:serine/threonine-protein kinase
MSSEPNRKIFQCRGAESDMAAVPLDSSGERDFLRERVGLYALATLVGSVAFFLAAFLIEGLWPPRIGAAVSVGRPDLLFHLAACAVLFLMWITTRQPGLSASALQFADGAGTIATFALYACMAGSMPAAWRPEMLYLLVVITVLFYRAAIVPSAPLRTAWISALSAAPAPILAAVIYKRQEFAEVSRGQTVAYAVLWAALAVCLSILLSFVTFRLRKSVARARRLGQYTLGAKLGEGGMGIVYRAEHEMLRRPTAIKLLPPGRAGEDSLKRFEREVQQTARLTNPHTVSIYDYGRTPDGLFYYVMEYLDGVDLEDLIKESGPMQPGRAVRILRQVCAALAEAHGIGLIHRDIKPANVFLCERGGIPDIAKVLDFGLVREITGSADPRLTAENVVHGTPQYLAPEAIRNSDSIDARSDLYALGAVGYFLLTGTPVFSGRGSLEVIHHHLQTIPESMSKRLGRPIPPKLEAVVMSCLAKNPDDRPESARALAKVLHDCDDVQPWDELDARRYWQERATRLKARTA